MNKKLLILTLTMLHGASFHILAISESNKEAQAKLDAIKANAQTTSADMPENVKSLYRDTVNNQSASIPDSMFISNSDLGALIFLVGISLYGGYKLTEYILAPLIAGAYRSVKGTPTNYCVCKGKEESVGGVNCNRWCLKSGWSGKVDITQKGIACICKNGSKEEQSCTSKLPPRCWNNGWTGKVYTAAEYKTKQAAEEQS